MAKDCKIADEVDILVLSIKYTWLEKVHSQVVNKLTQHSLTELKEHESYDIIKHNYDIIDIIEKRITTIETGRNYNYRLLERQYEDYNDFSGQILCTIGNIGNVWSSDNVRYGKHKWDVTIFKLSSAIGCEDWSVNMNRKMINYASEISGALLVIENKHDTARWVGQLWGTRWK